MTVDTHAGKPTYDHAAILIISARRAAAPSSPRSPSATSTSEASRSRCRKARSTPARCTPRSCRRARPLPDLRHGARADGRACRRMSTTPSSSTSRAGSWSPRRCRSRSSPSTWASHVFGVDLLPFLSPERPAMAASSPSPSRPCCGAAGRSSCAASSRSARLAQHVHADRARHRRGVSLQRGRHAWRPACSPPPCTTRMA